MTQIPLNRNAHLGLWLCLTLILCATQPTDAVAQDQPTQRQLRTYIPSDQLVSLLPSTPFDQFIDFLNPIFQRVTGKMVIDPESRKDPIGISIAGMHFLDALELVLDYNGLAYRETERFFMVEPAQEADLVVGADVRSGVSERGIEPASKLAAKPASLLSREIQINAILFDLNQTKARDIGIDWNIFFGDPNSGNQGSGSGSSGSNMDQRPRFYLKTDKVFDNLSDYIAAPDLIDFSHLTQFFRLLEDQGVGETIANPQVTVQSGEKGEIQIGSDIPVQTRDYAGNTLTQFFSTGIIIDVTPTVITEPLADSVGSPTMDFIHLDVLVEKSNSRVSLAGPIIDKNTANTKVLLLDGEQTVIGGLYSTEETVSRRGIPVLKDLPGWFFGLRYLFGRTQKTTVQKELLIVLQAQMLDPLRARSLRPFEMNLLERQRQQMRSRLERAQRGIEAGASQ